MFKSTSTIHVETHRCTKDCGFTCYIGTTKWYSIDTEKGLSTAERAKARLQNKWDSVQTETGYSGRFVRFYCTAVLAD